ncbi:restriction endonuclease subunit S [Weissella confusa]|uniref:restriction endonuclease subunit S n=1 Tax=Weissella confusa TaxID=1583 RepID=UPI00396F37FE
MGDLYSIRGGKRIPKGWKLQDEDNGNVYLRVADLHDGTVTSTNLKYAPVEVIDKIDAYRISSGDLYVTIAGTIGRSGIIPNEFDNVLLTENAVKLMPILPKLTAFTYLTIVSNVVQFQFSELTNAVAQPKLSIRSLNSTLIPLPP